VSGNPLLDIGWNPAPGVRAWCTTRQGGVSRAPWDSFNLAMHVGDDPVHVARNRRRLRELCGLDEEPVWLTQVHGVAVADLDAGSGSTAPREADASVTSRAGVVCVVMVADCLPVLFAAKDGSRIAAAHAGWRGLATGILENTVAALGMPGNRLRAWLGPAISQRHFEVRRAFVATDPESDVLFAANERGRWQADLAGLARRRLGALGVDDISGGEWCTFADRKRFFSHRRDGQGGRLATLICKDMRQSAVPPVSPGVL
jgi:YfiH family protein